MANEKTISVSVCYAISAQQQEIIAVTLPEKSTLDHAVRESGILNRHGEIDLTQYAVGIFGKIRENDYVLKDHDRIEIYKPLIIDPMQARRMRAGLQD